MKKKFKKLVISLILISLSFMCFIFPKKTIIQEEYNCSPKYTQTITTENQGLKDFLNYIGIFLLIMSLWIWRKELNFNQLGFVGGSDIAPTTPNDSGQIPQKSFITEDSISSKIDDDFAKFKSAELEHQIENLFKENPLSVYNLSVLSRKFNRSTSIIEKALFQLMTKKVIRKDTYPGRKGSIYSYTESIINKAIDYFISNFIKEEIISDYRYVSLKMQYEIDAIIKTRYTNYIIEIKDKYSNGRVENGINQLMKIEEQISLEPVTLILIMVIDDEIDQSIFKDLLSQKMNLELITIDRKKITTPNKL